MSQQQQVTKLFENSGLDGSYQRFYQESHTAYNHDFLMRMARVEEFLVPYVKPNVHVLDLGCGPGPMVNFFCSRGAFFHGVDIAQSMLDSIEREYRAGDYWKQIELRVGSCEELPYPDGTFDIVVGMGLIEYLDDMLLTLKEMSRVTKRRGVAIVTTPHLHSLNRIIIRHSEFVTRLYQFWRKQRGQDVAPRYEIAHRELAPSTLDGWMTDVGFKTIGQAFYDYKLVCYPFTRICPNLSFQLNRLVENKGPSFLANGYIGLYQFNEHTPQTKTEVLTRPVD